MKPMKPYRTFFLFALMLLIAVLSACTFGFDPNAPPAITISTVTPGGQNGEVGIVTNIVTGLDSALYVTSLSNGAVYRIR